jgi:predicted phosphodiesterase
MARTISPAAEAVKRELKRFPNTPTATLAKKLYTKSPELWPRYEACRSMVRRYRGNNGELHRKDAATQEHFRPNVMPGKVFDALPEPWQDLKDSRPYRISAERLLVLGDIHVPFHDKRALAAAIEYGTDAGVDAVLLNGDLCDFYNISRWERDPRQRAFKYELEQIRTVLEVMQRFLPGARIYFKSGNHEDRYERYLKLKAPELLDLECLSLGNVLGLDKLGITEIGDAQRVQFGQLSIIHGHEIQTSSAVSPARGLQLKARTTVLGSHHHKASATPPVKDLLGNVSRAWTTGCLCNLTPDYRIYNEWNHGFAVVEITCPETGAFKVDNLEISKTGGIYS